MNGNSGSAKSHQYWLAFFLAVCITRGFATSVAIVQGRDYVVIAADSTRTVVGNTGHDIGTRTECKIHQTGTMYFVMAGHTVMEQYDAQAIAKTIGRATDDPRTAAARFQDAIMPKFAKLMVRLNIGDAVLLKRINATPLLLGIAFIAIRNGVPVMSVRSFNWEKLHGRYSLAPIKPQSCVGPCLQGSPSTLLRMTEGPTSPHDGENIQDRSMAVAAVYAFIQLDIAHFPKTVGAPIVELTLDVNGERWASGEEFCKGKASRATHK